MLRRNKTGFLISLVERLTPSTVTSKIFLGTFIILAASLFGMMVIYDGLKAAREAFETVIQRDEPLRRAAYEMEIKVIGSGMGVMRYLNAPAAKYRERVKKRRAIFGSSERGMTN